MGAGGRGRVALGVVLGALGALAAAAPAMAVTRYADDQGLSPAPCTSPNAPCSLPDAINASGFGDEIQVGGGDYATSVTLAGGQTLIQADFQNGGVTGGEATIHGGNQPAVMLQGSGATSYEVRGFTLRSTLSSTVVLNQDASPLALTIADNVFDSYADGDGHIDLNVLVGDAPVTATIEDNVFTNDGDEIPDLTTERTAVNQSTGANSVINLIARGNTFDGYTSALQMRGGFVEATDNVVRNAYDDDDPSGRSVFSFLTSTTVDLLRNSISTYPAQPVNRGVHISGGGNPGSAEADQLVVTGTEEAAFSFAGANTGSLRIEDSLIASLQSPIDITNAVSALLRGVTIPAHAGLLSLDMNGNFDTTIDSSIIGEGIEATAGADCIIVNSRGTQTSGGDSCEQFTTDANPQFVDDQSATPDYRLQATSPLIDAGNPAQPGTIDVLGAPRTQDGNGDGIAVRDMGAYEVADTFAPKTTITSAPPPLTQVKVKKPKKPKKGKKKKKVKQPAVPVAFSFTATEAGAKFECSFDGGPFAPCAGTFAATAGLGSHTFAVRGTDAFGNTDSPPATATFQIVKKKAKKKKKKK